MEDRITSFGAPWLSCIAVRERSPSDGCWKEGECCWKMGSLGWRIIDFWRSCGNPQHYSPADAQNADECRMAKATWCAKAEHSHKKW